MIKYLILKLIKFYQKVLSPDQGFFNGLSARRICRFYPTCSEYVYLAIKKYGTGRGCWRGLKRILRCHPRNPGGVDLP